MTRCANCGREPEEKEQVYSIRIEMFANAGPVAFGMEDLLADHLAKMDKIISDMENADPEEASDQVHESYTFELCSRCRKRIHGQLKAKAQLGAG